MSLTVYGMPASRAFRVLWAAEEAGLPYANEPLSFKDPAIKAPAFGLERWPRIADWHRRCYARPAAQRAVALREAR
jgi:glutathione S-transferase